MTAGIIHAVYGSAKKPMANTDKFLNFIHAFGAARLLLQRANKEGVLLEGLVLYAAITDGILRIGLILKRQTVSSSTNMDEDLIAQNVGGMFYTERQIQKLAFEEGIIAEELYKELSELYDHRNAFVHRFFLTDLEYGQLPRVLERYEVAYKKLYKIVYDLEAEQIQLGVGMTVPGRSTNKSERAIKEDVLKKIDSSGAVSDSSRKTESKN